MDNLKFEENFKQQLLAHSFHGVRDAIGNSVHGLFLRVENPVLYLVCFYGGEGVACGRQLLHEYSMQMLPHLEDMGCTHLIPLGLFLGEGTCLEETPVVEDMRLHPVEWRVDLETGDVTAQKDKPTKLLGIEKWLQAAAEGKETAKPVVMANPKGRPWACMGIFAICLVLLGVTKFLPQGDEVIRQFGLSRSGILQGEYYRFFSSMFLHSGVTHLLSNCIYLYYFGVRAERFLGWKKFLALYLLSGICAGVASVLFHDVLAIGASGAIFGLLGAMLLLTKKHGAAYTDMNYATILLLAFMSMSAGFLEMGVDNFAHMGGFFGGILMFFLFLKHQPRKGE